MIGAALKVYIYTVSAPLGYESPQLGNRDALWRYQWTRRSLLGKENWNKEDWRETSF